MIFGPIISNICQNTFMKSIITLAFSLSTIVLSAQTYTIIASTVYHKEKSQLSLEADISPSPKDTRKAFQKYLKSNHGIKLKRSGDFYAVKAQKIAEITDVQIDLYAKFKEDKNEGTQMSLFARKGYDLYITPQNDAKAFAGMRMIFNSFLKEYLINYYEEKFDNAVDVYSGFTKDKKKLVDDIEDLTDDIEDNKKEIEKLRKENSDKAEELKKKKQEAKELDKKISETDSKLQNIKTKKQGIN